MSIRITIEHDDDLSVNDFAEELREGLFETLESGESEAYIVTVNYSTCEYVECPHHSAWQSMCGIIELSGHTGVYDSIRKINNEYLREVASELSGGAYGGTI